MSIKHFITLTKALPIVIASLHLANTILSFFYCNDIPLNYIGGVSLLPVIYLYIASYTFNLCAYYRMFLHYIVIMNIIHLYDHYIGIPLDDINYFMCLVTFSIIMMLLVIYLKFFK